MVWLIGFCLVFLCLVAGVWLLKLFGELLRALLFGVAGGLKLFGQIVYWFWRKIWRLVRGIVRRAAPALGWLLEWICVGLGIAGIWIWFHCRRLYVRREVKARSK